MKEQSFTLFSYIPKTLFSFASEWSTLKHLSRVQSGVVASLVWEHCDSKKAYIHASGRGFFIESRKLRGALGKNYLDILSKSGLVTFDSGYDYKAKQTRRYELTQLAHDFIDRYHSLSSKKGTLVAVKINGAIEKQRKPGQAVLSRDSAGNHSKNKLRINSVVRIDTDSLEGLRKGLSAHKDRLLHGITPHHLTDEYKLIGEAIANKPNDKAIDYVLRRFNQAVKLIHLATSNSALPEGHIYQIYQECVTGRLYGHGEHLQNAPREVRHAALSGQYDYDFDNCHYAILHQLAQKLNIHTPHITEYLQHKRFHRARLANELGVSEKVIKRCLIALIYGAALKTKPYSRRTSSGEIKKESPAILNVLGEHRATTLINDAFFAGLSRDIKQAGKAVIESYRNPSNGKLINALGKSNKISKNNSGKDKGVLVSDPLAHILQGYEAKMLSVAVELFGDKITLLQHDGFTSPDKALDVKLLSSEIEKQTGLSMTLTIERIGLAKIQKVASPLSLVA